MKTIVQEFAIIVSLVFLPLMLLAQDGPCNTNACSVCDVSATITSISGGVIDNNISTINGSTGAGQTETSNTPLSITATDCGVITINVELDFDWHQGEQINWIHGISFENSSGWLAAEGVIIPANPGWIFMNSITGVCSNTTYGAGYYWDPPGTNCIDSGNLSNYDGNDCNNSNDDICEGDSPFLVDGDPSDNWGIDCETDCPQFGFSLTYCPSESGTTDEVITFVLTEDGETGGWNQSDGCIFSLSFPITINAAGVQLPDEDIGPICQDSCVTIDAGNGCDGYLWSNGATTSEITVCPTETTTYSVTVSSDLACETSGEVTVVVESCCDVDAGVLVADPSTLCPGESSNISVTNYQDGTDYSQVIIIVNDNGIIVEIVNGDSYSLSSDICEIYSVYSYNYLTNGGATIPQIGSSINTINCDIECCDLINIEVVFEDVEAPIFANGPLDFTIDCIDDLPILEDQPWSDNCIGNGVSIGEEFISFTNCDGGNVIRTWTATDDCGNEVIHSQTIIILPIEAPVFIDLPTDITLDCSTDIPSVIDLAYSNSQSESCLISGTVSPTIIADTTQCGGTITYMWDYIDECDRMINHAQVVTLLPPPAPVFVNAPADVTIHCGDEIPQPISSLATNGLLGRCLLEEDISPVINDQSTSCGGNIIYSWEYTDDCGNAFIHEQMITILPPALPFFIDLPSDITVECSDGSSEAIDLMVSNSTLVDCSFEVAVSPTVNNLNDDCGNQVSYTWEFTDDCGNSISHTQIINIDPAPIAAFIDPPLDITINCEDYNAETLSINYDNGEIGTCNISGFIGGEILGEPSSCGNTIQQIWTFVDDCGRTIEHIQNVTINPPSVPNFQNVPPTIISVSCGDIPQPTSLDYTNGESGSCEITGSVQGQITGSYDSCGGTLLQNWAITDLCENEISYTQTIDVLPADEPIWVSLPADITLDCDEDYPPAEILNYNNGASGDCSIQGTVVATSIEGDNEIEYTWTYNNLCTSSSISHTQIITRLTSPELALNPSSITICEGTLYDLGSIVVNDLNGGILDVQYFYDDGQEIFDLNILVETDTEISIVGINENGCTADVIFEIFVDPTIEVGGDGTLDICIGDEIYNLFDYLTAPTVLDGEWLDLQTSGADISDPYQASFAGVQEGSYDFQYIVSSNNACPNVSVVLTVTIHPNPEININSAVCNESWTSYTVEINTNGNDVMASSGDITTIATDIIQVENIVIAENLVLSFSDPLTSCSSEYIVIPPDCECPDVLAPISDGDLSICEGEVVLPLSVTVASGLMVNWYDSQVGGSLLLQNSLSYIPTNTEPGIYTFYAESVNMEGCISLTRTEVKLEIRSLPIANTVSMSQCGDANSNATFLLSSMDSEVNNNPLFIIQYYNNLLDAESSENELDDEYSTTESVSELIVKVISNNGCIAYATITLEIIELSEVTVNTECNTNGTETNPDDDFYIVTVMVDQNNSTSGTFDVIVDGVLFTTLPYEDGGQLEFPASNQSVEITIQDDSGVYCFSTYTIDLLSCSDACVIDFDVISTCDNGSTNGSGDDDFYTINFTASGINLSSSGFQLLVDGVEESIYNYNQLNSIVLAADGALHQLTAVDLDDGNCITLFETDILIPCSECNETVTAGADATLDCEVTSIGLAGISSILGVGVWTGPGGFSEIGYEAIVQVVGTYFFTVDFGQGCIVSDSLVVDVSNDIPLTDAGPDAMLTCEIDTALLVGTVVGGGGNFTYTWYDEMDNIISNTLTVEVVQSGSYYFEVKDLDTDCVSPRDVVIVTDKTDGPTAIIYADPGDILDCVIEIIYITNAIEQDVVYTWMVDNQPMTVPDISIDQPANIELYAIDTITGCQSSSFLNITSLEEYPIINMYTDEEINCEFTVAEIVGSTPTPGGNISFTWYNEDNEIIATDTNIINVTEPGMYYLELVDVVNGCNNKDSVVVEGFFDYPMVTASEDYMISCTQSELEINIAVAGNADDLNFHWTTEDGNIQEVTKDSVVTVTQAGQYIVEVVNEQSLCGTFDTIHVFASEQIYGSEVEVLDENCDQNADGVIILGEVVGGTAPFTFVFGGLVQTDNVIDDLSAGDYSFSIFDVNGCRFDTTVTISVVEPFEVDLESNITIQSDQFTSLAVDVNIPEEEIATVQWIPADGLSCDTCLTTDLDASLALESYEVVITDIYGCSSFATIRVVVEFNNTTTFPNIISANGDNENDYFSVYSDDENAEVLSMRIFDRWGEMVFSKASFSPNNPEEGWDGTYKNSDAIQGVYVYMVEMQLSEGKKVFSGDVTVIR